MIDSKGMVIYCMEGCICNSTGKTHLLLRIIRNDVEEMYCPKCNNAWPFLEDYYSDIWERTPHILSDEERLAVLETVLVTVIDCIHCDGEGTITKENKAIPNYPSGLCIEVACNHCGGSGKATMWWSKYCQVGETSQMEHCSNEVEFMCGREVWCCDHWVCGKHWVEAYEMCIICEKDAPPHAYGH